MEDILRKIVNTPHLHCRWINTLSMMENAGAKKIKNCEHPVFVSEVILKHSAEESRHAYYLKKQIKKVAENLCITYERKNLVAPNTSIFYLHTLDISVSRYLKEKYNLRGEKLKYAAYLLVTYAIEVRADELYPVYQKVLDETKSKVNVKSIIAEEENHLKEMNEQLDKFSDDAGQMRKDVCEMEGDLFRNWLQDLATEIDK